MPEIFGDAYQQFCGSFGLKKWVSAAAVADYGNAQAIAVRPTRNTLTTFRTMAGIFLNQSGSTVVLALAVRYAIATWTAWTVTAAGVATDATTAAQNATTGDFTLHNRAESGSGVLFSSDERFNILGIIQSAAGDQTTPVRLVEYWNGTSWTDIEASLFIADGLNGAGTGEKVLLWPMPFDWVVGGSGTNVPTTTYNLRVRYTTAAAGTANPVASQVFLGFAKHVIPGVFDGGYNTIIREHPLVFPQSGEALFPVASVASRANYFEIAVEFGHLTNHP